MNWNLILMMIFLIMVPVMMMALDLFWIVRTRVLRSTRCLMVSTVVSTVASTVASTMGMMPPAAMLYQLT